MCYRRLLWSNLLNSIGIRLVISRCAAGASERIGRKCVILLTTGSFNRGRLILDGGFQPLNQQPGRQ